jgi:hypothetical protein
MVAMAALAGGSIAGTTGIATAQDDFRARIYEMMPDTPVADIPARYLDPHCGTNGGPPSTKLDSFADFARCPVDPSTGLYEVWFSEDDENEYIALAHRGIPPGGLSPDSANVLYVQKVIYSLLIDADGLVQGYRVFTDPREDPALRATAYLVGDEMRGTYGYSNFVCQALPPGPGETPIEGLFIKQICTADVDTRHIVIERHYYYKPGQAGVDPLTGNPTTNQFESTSRIEMINRDLVPVDQQVTAPNPAPATPTPAPAQ